MRRLQGAQHWWSKVSAKDVEEIIGGATAQGASELPSLSSPAQQSRTWVSWRRSAAHVGAFLPHLVTGFIHRRVSSNSREANHHLHVPLATHIRTKHAHLARHTLSCCNVAKQRPKQLQQLFDPREPLFFEDPSRDNGSRAAVGCMRQCLDEAATATALLTAET